MKRFFTICLGILVLAGCSFTNNSKPTTTPDATVAPEKTVTPEVTVAPEETTETVVTTGKYIVTNTTGETVTELYIYKTGSKEKGKNYAEGGLEEGEDVTIDVEVSKEEAVDYAQTLEYTTESGRNEANYTTLHLEDVKINLLASDVDAYTSATPFSFGK